MTGLQAAWVLTKKVFSLTLILNALITISTLAELLHGFYIHAWRLYSPELISGNLFVVAIIAAIVNIFPSASIGRKLHTGRFLFHHYVYGFFVLILSILYVIAFTSVSLVMLFLVNSASIAVNTGRFFVLAGLTLLLDDLPDVNKKIESFLNGVKSQVYRMRRLLHYLQLATGVVTFYIFIAILTFEVSHSSIKVVNYMIMGTLLVTSITSSVSVRKKTWLKITQPETKAATTH